MERHDHWSLVPVLEQCSVDDGFYGPVGVSTLYDRGVSADEETLPRTGSLSVVIQTSESSSISNCCLTP